jgi:hypothetical protein
MFIAYALVRWNDIEATVEVLPLAENEPVSFAVFTSVAADVLPVKRPTMLISFIVEELAAFKKYAVLSLS